MTACESWSPCPSNRLFEGDKRVVFYKLKGNISHNFNSPQSRVWCCIKCSLWAGVLLTITSGECLLVTSPDAGYQTVLDRMKYILIIRWWSAQISSEDDETKHEGGTISRWSPCPQV